MKKLFASILVIFSIQLCKAQELETILLAADDASLLTQNYLSPAMEGLMYSMNGGWATTAKVHKKFGFDITIGANLSFVPDEAQFFDFIPDQYEFLTLPNGEDQLPTLMSEDDVEHYKAVILFVGSDLVRVGILVAFPAITLFLLPI